jgi:hypothetical protein
MCAVKLGQARMRWVDVHEAGEVFQKSAAYTDPPLRLRLDAIQGYKELFLPGEEKPIGTMLIVNGGKHAIIVKESAKYFADILEDHR